MLSLQWTELTCPVCATRFDTVAVVADEPDGGEAASTSERRVPAKLLRYLVHACCRCGYAGDIEHFGDDTAITPEVRARVWAELAPKLAPSVRIPSLLVSAAGSEKHEAAAKVAEWSGASALTIGAFWIRAARCAIDEADVEAERYYARFAARWFGEALERNEVDPQDRAHITYGLGELWLHVGDLRRAVSWFERV